MATYLAAIIIGVFLLRAIIYFINRAKRKDAVHSTESRVWLKYLACFGSGVLFTNFVPHFVHGISGELFPAPFGKYLGTGFPEYMANVIWGLVNLYFGYNLFIRGEVLSWNRYGKVFFFLRDLRNEYIPVFRLFAF